MADSQKAPSSAATPALTSSFSKGLVKDLADMYLGEGVWSHARNAITAIDWPSSTHTFSLWLFTVRTMTTTVS